MTRKVMDQSWTYEHYNSEAEKAALYYVQSAGHYYSKPIYCCRREGLDSLLIKYTLDGTGYLKYNDVSYTVRRHQLFIIDCMAPHYYGSSKTDLWEMVWIHFNGNSSRLYVQQILKNNGPVFDLSAEPNNTILPKLLQIHQLIRSHNYQANIVASLLLNQIITELLLRSSEEQQDLQQLPPSTNHAIRYIKGNYEKPLTLDQLADVVGMSKYHFARQFKRHTGFSPHEYLIKQRIQESKILLKNTNLSVEVVSHRVGFESVSHFIQTFKKSEGVTPLRFRRMWN